jgi:hypothetical protein
LGCRKTYTKEAPNLHGVRNSFREIAEVFAFWHHSDGHAKGAILASASRSAYLIE